MATIKVSPRYVEDRTNEQMCRRLSVEIPNDFNYGMDTVKAVNLPMRWLSHEPRG
jgi:heterodisulfide reductase subunit A-like polyferredoxin